MPSGRQPVIFCYFCSRRCMTSGWVLDAFPLCIESSHICASWQCIESYIQDSKREPYIKQIVHICSESSGHLVYSLCFIDNLEAIESTIQRIVLMKKWTPILLQSVFMMQSKHNSGKIYTEVSIVGVQYFSGSLQQIFLSPICWPTELFLDHPRSSSKTKLQRKARHYSIRPRIEWSDAWNATLWFRFTLPCPIFLCAQCSCPLFLLLLPVDGQTRIERRHR